MDCSMPGFPVLHHLPEFVWIHVHWVVMPSNHLVLCQLLILLPLIFPSIRVFSNESALCIRWPKYWSFSFCISPSNEYSRLISLISKYLHIWGITLCLQQSFESHGILVPWPGMEDSSPTEEEQSLHHWRTREFPPKFPFCFAAYLSSAYDDFAISFSYSGIKKN